MKYFRDHGPKEPVLPREIIRIFFRELFMHPLIPDSIRSAHALMVEIFDPIAIEAQRHNCKALNLLPVDVKKLTMLTLASKCHVASMPGICYLPTTEEYIYFSQTGAIMIHRSKRPFDGNWHVPMYRENALKTLIISRPGGDFMDVWGNPLIHSVEYFTAHEARLT